MPDSARSKATVPLRPLESLIHIVRGRKVMLDSDLASLYGVETKVLNQAVRRNLERFPEDFMFELNPEESASMRSQIVTASKRNIRYQSLVFTEQGVAMLSSVLKSSRAIEMNILIMRAFVRMRELIASNKDIAARVERLESGQERVASVLEILVEDIDRLGREVKEMKATPPQPRRKIGFRLGSE